MTEARQAKKLADYQAPVFLTDRVELTFELAPEQTRVTAVSQYRRQGDRHPLRLDGQHLQLESVAIDGQRMTDYVLENDQLILSDLPDSFTLTIVTLINPKANTALEGLYLSGGAYCTQCEAEGFRRITYYQDRPDVMAVFTTHIIAPASEGAYLLSNGNLIADQLLADGRRKVSWHDPFAKPCYLFALVAGNFDELVDTFTTCSGREVALKFYVDQGNRTRATFALAALKRAMRFDEEVYGLEYDLDIYMVVAVDFFNMGAMENKGLNVFNSKFVLADATTATDTDYFNIESIIGHEYFHNWTGNRVTCRDWFQLSLKEGLTVFRDQQFSAAMASATLSRIDAIKTIRTAQFAEDAGPMAHPIRPEQVLEMNNFYTVTVYDKGAEVIRMMHTLLGESGFRRGMDTYFARFDGQAVTCDDFVQSMQDANAFDLTQFKRWYQQAGTPELSVRSEYCALQQLVRLQVQQQTPATADGSAKLPFMIPLKIELISADLQQRHATLLLLKEATQQFEFSGFTAAPIVVWLEDFSAPVKLQQQTDVAQLLFIAAHASDGVARWDAMQQLWSILVSQWIEHQECQLPAALIAVCRQWLEQPLADLAFTAELLTLPSFATLAEQYSQIPIDAILTALESFKLQLAMALRHELTDCYLKLPTEPYQYEALAVGRRQLRQVCLQYLALLGSSELLLSHYHNADNMTERQGAIQAAVAASLPVADLLLADLYQNYADDVLVFDKWANLQVSLPNATVFEKIEQVITQPQYAITNPNRVRAVFGAFSHLNPSQFHRQDGKGYQCLAALIGQVDEINPQLSARLLTPLLSWRRFDPLRQQCIEKLLQALLQKSGLSNDLYEKVYRSLN